MVFKLEFLKKLGFNRFYFQQLLTLFIIAVVAKGGVLFQALSLDDYHVYIDGATSNDIKLCIGQGRFIMAAILLFFDSLGVTTTDTYIASGFLALLLQSVFILSIFRFIGIESQPTALIVGAIVITHPYVTEIYTYRCVLFSYSVALIFTILALELIIQNKKLLLFRLYAFLAILSMLLTYQIFFNYIIVTIIFSFLFGIFYKKNIGFSRVSSETVHARALELLILSIISVFSFLIIIQICKEYGIIDIEGRVKLILFEKIPFRINQILQAYVGIYFLDEPIFPGWLKKYIAGIFTLLSILSLKGFEFSFNRFIFVILILLLLVPISLGVIVAFDNWWPVPRALAHVSLVVGLSFLLLDLFLIKNRFSFLSTYIFILRVFVLITFIFLDNQILADQLKINQWDKMMANRIISRLEILPNFDTVRSIYINGGTWSYPIKLKTMQGDMNLSAFFPGFSKISLLSAVSGYQFERVTEMQAQEGEEYCRVNQPWPNSSAISISNGMAIICLKK